MEELKKEMETLLTKYGVTLQIRQDIVFVPNKKPMENTVEEVETELTGGETVVEEATPEVSE